MKPIEIKERECHPQRIEHKGPQITGEVKRQHPSSVGAQRAGQVGQQKPAHVGAQRTGQVNKQPKQQQMDDKQYPR